MRTERPDFPRDYLFSRLRIAEQEFLMDDEEPSKYLTHLHGTVEWRDPEDEEQVTPIGAFGFYLFDCNSALNDEASWHDIFDTEGTTFDAYQELYEFKCWDFNAKVEKAVFSEEYPITFNLMLMDRLVIYPEHRGFGIGLMTLRAIIHQFRSFAGLIAMKPFPLQFESSEMNELNGLPRYEWGLEAFNAKERPATQALRRYYARLGFKKLPSSDYMVRDTLNLPATEDLLCLERRERRRLKVSDNAISIVKPKKIASLDEHRQRRSAKPLG